MNILLPLTLSLITGIAVTDLYITIDKPCIKNYNLNIEKINLDFNQYLYIQSIALLTTMSLTVATLSCWKYLYLILSVISAIISILGIYMIRNGLLTVENGCDVTLRNYIMSEPIIVLLLPFLSVINLAIYNEETHDRIQREFIYRRNY